MSQASLRSGSSQLRPFNEICGDKKNPYQLAVLKPVAPPKAYNLSDRCIAMTAKAFKMMDKDKSGEITAADIEGFYDVSQNPEFISGHKSKRQILKAFLNRFEGTKGNRDGCVTRDEWFNYYSEVRGLLSSDEYFVKMMESAW